MGLKNKTSIDFEVLAISSIPSIKNYLPCSYQGFIPPVLFSHPTHLTCCQMLSQYSNFLFGCLCNFRLPSLSNLLMFDLVTVCFLSKIVSLAFPNRAKMCMHNSYIDKLQVYAFFFTCLICQKLTWSLCVTV